MKEIPMTVAPAEINPKCPHCTKELTELWMKTKGLGIVEQHVILMCPHCHSLLGYSAIGR